VICQITCNLTWHIFLSCFTLAFIWTNPGCLQKQAVRCFEMSEQTKPTR
jgi:hypothetical protein